MGRARKTERGSESSGTASVLIWILENGSGKNGTDFGIRPWFDFWIVYVIRVTLGKLSHLCEPHYTHV